MCHHCYSSITCCLFKLNAWQKVKLGQKFMVFDPQDRDPLPKHTYLSICSISGTIVEFFLL